eukprot:TRINITY_DN989_c0_g1_i5.p1 TRINITY_DN989_c0_g1~~TRINITY_DN989_c0_g1_i5.p1  ORF type:complete len:289 (+),score=89.27 TRINITY_DN989_c0_g1_i5:68-868(+)
MTAAVEGCEGVCDSILSAVGVTPMIRARRINTGPCELLLKLELLNPSGYLADRYAVAGIELAEARGRLAPGRLVVTCSHGPGAALVCAAKGYPLVLVMPANTVASAIAYVKLSGAEVVLCEAAAMMATAQRVAGERGGVFVDTTCATLSQGLVDQAWRQCGGRLDAVVVPCERLGALFKEKLPTIEVICEKKATAGPNAITPEALAAARELFTQEGVLGGPVTGGLVAAALKYCRAQSTPRRVLCFANDSGLGHLAVSGGIYTPPL